MKNKSILPVVTVIVLIVGAIVGISVIGGDNEDSNSNSSSSTVVQSDSGSVVETETESTGVDRYENFGPTALADATGTKRVLFFHASWCAVCNAFEKEIEEIGIPEGITIIKANYDDERELKKRYKVSVQSTFLLLDDNEEEVRRWPFGQGLSDISDLYDLVESS